MEEILSLECIEILDAICKRIVIINTKSEIVHMSEDYCEFLSVVQNEIIGKHITEVVENLSLIHI